MATSAGVLPSPETSASIIPSPTTTIFILCAPASTQIETPLPSPITSSFTLPTTRTSGSTSSLPPTSFTLPTTLTSSPFLITSSSTSTTLTTSSGEFNATTSTLSQSLHLKSSSQLVSSETQAQTTPLSKPGNQATTSSPNNGDRNQTSKAARNSIAAALAGSLVPLLFFGVIGVLFIRWRRRRRAAAVIKLAHRFDDIPLDSHMHLRRGETNDALPVNKTLFHRRTHSRREGSLRATPDAQRSDSAPQAQFHLAEENLALRTRVREMEGMSIMHSSASESDTPPDYDEAGDEHAPASLAKFDAVHKVT